MSDQTDTGNGAGCIAIVDDEPAIVEIAASVLEDAGYEVLRATSAEDSLRQTEARRIDAVLTDICMSGMDGFALIEALMDRDPAIKVIVMTGYDSYDMVRSALVAGAYDYLDKPLDRHDEIVAKIDRAVEATRLVRSNAALLERLTSSNLELERANARLLDLNRRLRLLANTDSLTRLYNRRYADEAIAREVSRSNRYADPLSVAVIDVDHFKWFNDRHGHEGGDRALQKVAEILRESARRTDVVARYGGEEFMAVLPKTAPEAAMIFAERLCQSIRTSAVPGVAEAGELTVSIGVAGVSVDDGACDPRGLVRIADAALYGAKKAGRDRALLASAAAQSSSGPPAPLDAVTVIGPTASDDPYGALDPSA